MMMARMLNGRNRSTVMANLGKCPNRAIGVQMSIGLTVKSVLGAGMLACAAACGGDADHRSRPVQAIDKGPLLLIVFDAVDASRVSHLGYERETTPNLDALAEQGVTFSKAFTPAPYTLAAIPSLLTGRLPDRHGVTDKSRNLNDEEITLAERLSAVGYRTYAAISNPNGSSFFGAAQGFDSYLELFREAEDQERIDSSGKLIPGAANPRAAMKDGPAFHIPIADEFIETVGVWADERQVGETPFYYLHIMEPHWPYAPPEPFRSQFLKTEYADDIDALNDRIRIQKITPAEDDLPELEQAVISDLYDGNLAYADWALGEILAILETKGVLDEFLIIVTSDHGEAFWQHGIQGHNVHLFDEMVHVPLVVRFPKGRGRSNLNVERLASIMDIVPSLCDWLELDTDGPRFDGLLLDDVIDGATSDDRQLLFRTNDLHPTVGIRSATRKSMSWRQPKTGKWLGVRFYDITTDSEEQIPLLPEEVKWSERHEVKINRLNAQIDEAIASKRAAREEELAPEVNELLNDLGYTE
jgi:arylsulfatase A-like enzyme